MSDFYWELMQHDGTSLEIPPDLVEIVKNKMAKGEPISTKSMVIPAKQIRYFRKTSKPFHSHPLLEEVAQVFNEPLITDTGGVQSRWVKKEVTHSEWSKYYSHGYRRLADEGGMVTVAFRQPIHQIDVNKTQDCTPYEIEKLEKTT